MNLEKLHDQLNKYKIEIYSLSEEDGGGFVAEIPKLGAVGDGLTPEEAIRDVKEVGLAFLKILYEDNKKLPETDMYKAAEEYSGKFALRMSKSTHKQLVERADIEGVSVNQLINQYIVMGIGFDYGKNSRHTVIMLPNQVKQEVKYEKQIEDFWTEISDLKTNIMQ